MKRVLIIGATSAIAHAVSREYAHQGASFHLVGRNSVKLDEAAADLRVRGAKRCTFDVHDLLDFDRHEQLVKAAVEQLGGLDIVLIAHGTLPDAELTSASRELAVREFAANGTSVISLCCALVDELGAGATLAVISSVAGDRGRASNYLYGAAKASVSAYLSGLGQALRVKDINVLTIKPGFVDTPMTAAFKKGPLWAKPEGVARAIVRAIDKRKAVAYVPWFWWVIMTIIKAIPEPVFRRLRL